VQNQEKTKLRDSGIEELQMKVKACGSIEVDALS
jgi:hypothetical protein